MLFRSKALARVVLGTTNWGEVDKEVGENREQQLAKTFWNPMTASGSKSLRFDKTEKSARAFLDVILGQMKFGGNEEILDYNVQQTQNELDRKIPETAASEELRYTLPKMQKEGVNFEKVAPESIKKQKNNNPKMTNNLPVMILYSFLSPFTVIWTDSLY